MADVRCPLAEAALISRHEPAILSAERKLLFYELDDVVSLVASHLLQEGVQAGDRVGLFVPNDWRCAALMLGILRAGAVACPLNTRQPPDTALAQLRFIGARHVIARASPESRAGREGMHLLDPDALLARRADSPVFEWDQHMDLDRPATLFFTSGSSGEPKAVLHRFGAHYYSARGSNESVRLRSHDRWLISLPLYHVGGWGIVVRCLLAGAAMAFPEKDESLSAAVERMGVTHLSLVDTLLRRLLDDPAARDSLGTVREILLGGGPVNPTLIREAMARKWPVRMSYGMTEMASQICTVPADAPPHRRFTSGKVLRHREIRIAPDGEILVRGATRFDGYATRGGRETDADRDWFATGDLGSLDEEGYLTVVGRKDNMFVSGGENIHPEEVERALAACEGVECCCVVPVPDDEFGQRPAAFVKGGSGYVAALERVLPRYKIPIAFWPWPDDEPVGIKPDRRHLAELARAFRGVRQSS